MKCLCNGKNYQLLIYLVFQLFPPQQTVSGNILQSETAVRDNFIIIIVIWYVVPDHIKSFQLHQNIMCLWFEVGL